MAGVRVTLRPTLWWPGDPEPPSPRPRPGILLDRDGTLNVEVDHLDDVDLIEPLPGAQAAVARAAAAGLRIGVVTNQSVIGRGMVTEAEMATMHARLHELFPQVELVVHCPHLPDDGCPCRKPNVLMLHVAMARLGIDPRRCAYVGDNASDLGAARGAGIPGYLVRTGHGEAHVGDAPSYAATVVDDVAGAIEAHLANIG